MKRLTHIYIFLIISLSMASCMDEYDPIGNNKPLPVLKISPSVIAFDGNGGEMSIDIETNAEAVEILSAPSWIIATLSGDLMNLNVTSQVNDEVAEVRSGVIQLSTLTGENEAVQYIRCVQAAKDGKIHFDSFGNTVLDPNWKKTGTGEASIGGGSVTLDSKTYLTYQNPSALICQPDNVVTTSVDIKGGNGGLRIYVNDDPDDCFIFRFTMDNNTNTGKFFAFRNTTPKALADKIPGDRIDNSEMPEIPAAGERDDYFRIECTNAYRWPYWWQCEVNIYSLTTNMQGETQILKKHFRRKFEVDNPKPGPGYFGVIAWDGPCSFKNFTISAQTN